MAKNQTQRHELVEIQRAEFDGAAALDQRQFRCQMGAAFLAAGALCVSGIEWGTALGVAAIGLVVFSMVLSHKSRARRALAERARRATLVVDGLGIRMPNAEMLELGRQASISAEELKLWADPGYFKTQEPPGPPRAAEMLAESAFWTEDLFEKSATAMWRGFLVIGVAAVLCLLLGFGVLGASNVPNELRIIFTLAPSLIWGEAALRALSFQAGARAVHDVRLGLKRLETDGCPRDDFFVMLLNYNSAVEGAPLIVDGLYDKNKDRLNQLWDQHKRSKD